MSGGIDRLGVALHDLADLAKVLAVADAWIVQPTDPWEVIGYVFNVVFTCGAIPEDHGTVKVIDSRIANERLAALLAEKPGCALAHWPCKPQ